MYLLTEGRTGRENIWLEVREYGPSAVKSVRTYLLTESQIFPRPSDLTQPISILSYDHLR